MFQLTGTITNKQLNKDGDTNMLTFGLLATNKEGKTIGLSCHAWGETANQLNKLLYNGCKARVNFATKKRSLFNYTQDFFSYRATGAVLVEISTVELKSSPRIQTATWGLWRQGKGWFREIKALDKFNPNRAVSFTEQNKKACCFKSFEECKDQQETLSAAFGCRMIIKPLER